MEDEDLELLRKAALQTLQAKKNKPTPAPQQQPQQQPQAQPQPQQQQPVQIIPSLNPQAVPFVPIQQPAVVPQPWNNFTPQLRPTVVPPMHYGPPVRIPGGIIPNQRPNFMPNVIPAPTAINMPLSIVPIAPSMHVTSSVQLSPRSAAFVSQNNDALLRRQHDRSPYRATSPSRWSPSPPRQRRRSLSKSPARYRDKSLSPRRNQDRKPGPIRNTSRDRRQDRSRSPIRRKSRSPVLRKRSNSKSPSKRAPNNRNNYYNGRNGSYNDTRRPLRRSPGARPNKTSNERDGRYGSNKSNSNKNDVNSTKAENKRSKTPEKARSKSRSLSPGADLAAVLEKLDEDFEIFPTSAFDDTELELERENEEINKENPGSEPPTPMETTTTSPSEIKSTTTTNDINEDELLGMSDDELSLGGNDIELDDLFNSDDSESENEGRFKSGARTSKTKPTAVLPFSELMESKKTVVKELTLDERTTNRVEDRRRRDDDRKRDWKKVRVPLISSTVKPVSKETASSDKNRATEKRTIQLKRPFVAPKGDLRDKESITITTGGSTNKKDDTGAVTLNRNSIRSRLGHKISEKDTKPLNERSVITGPNATSKPMRTKITWKSEKV
uniref:CSON010650 protein n=1 Tax=Culicoides sonorensis TaxID=179676 RepID=A0A336ME73_CULSO